MPSVPNANSWVDPMAVWHGKTGVVDDFDIKLFSSEWLACTDLANLAYDVYWKIH